MPEYTAEASLTHHKSDIIEITDFHAPELDIYARLSENQLRTFYEPAPGLFIAESPNVIERALKAGYEPVSLLVEKKHLLTQAKALLERCHTVPVYTAEFDVLTRLTGFALTRGLLCAMKRKALPDAETLCKGKKRIVILENVMNPTNLGAIFRNAAALNMDAVLLTPGCSDPLYRRASRVSMGTVFQVPWTILPSEDYIPFLQSMGFACAAMALRKDSVNIDDEHLNREEKLAIVLGTEGEGLNLKTIDACDYTVCIPMSHGVDSLNVAAASAIAFWQLGQPGTGQDKNTDA